MVSISKVEPNPDQPRKNFGEDELEELADSIKKIGIFQPILVQDKGDHYMIVAGERRWRAALKAGLKEVPEIIKNYTEEEITIIALLENIQRVDLNPIEEAQTYKKLIDTYHYKQDEVAEKVSKSRTAVTNSMRLLKLCDKVQEMVVEGMISEGHARALLAIEDPEKQYEVAQDIYDRGLNVRETEKLVKSLAKPSKKKAKKDLSQYQVHFDESAVKMAEALGVKVAVSLKDSNNGKIEIEFYSTDDFEKISDKLLK